MSNSYTWEERRLGAMEKVKIEPAKEPVVFDTKITPKMSKAGQAIASLLMDASIIKSMGGMGGCQTEIDIPEEYKDLVALYLEEKILSVDSIYLAMDRARIAEES